MVWKKLANLPTVDTRPGMTLLIWLLKHDGKPQPIGQLYKDSKQSEATMRECVKVFISEGLAAIEPNPNDSRQRLLYGTPKLKEKAEEHLRSMLPSAQRMLVATTTITAAAIDPCGARQGLASESALSMFCDTTEVRPMPVSWSIDSRAHLVTVTAQGKVERADMDEYLDCVTGARANSYRKIFDGSRLAEGAMAMEDMLALGARFRMLHAERHGPLAIVMPAERRARLLPVLGMLAAAPRPLRLFSSLIDAQRWVMSLPAAVDP